MNVQAQTEDEMKAAGHSALSGTAIRDRIVDATVQGMYRGGFRYTAFIRADGTVEGRNHVGTHDRGTWTIADSDDTFTVRWDHGWDHHTTRAYDVGGSIHFVDVETGEWRTSFTAVRRGSVPPAALHDPP